MASVSNNLSVLNIRGEDSVFLGNESLERNFLLSVLRRLAYDYKLFIFPQKTRCVPPPHASKVSRCSAIDRRPVVKKQRNLVNYLTSISLFNARKFVVCIFEISDEDLAPTE